MTDKLKTFIQENQQELDVFEPSQELWNKIDSGMNLNKTKWIKSKWLSGLKYFGFSASVFVIVFIFFKKSNPENIKLKIDEKSFVSAIKSEKHGSSEKDQIKENTKENQFQILKKDTPINKKEELKDNLPKQEREIDQIPSLTVPPVSGNDISKTDTSGKSPIIEKTGFTEKIKTKQRDVHSNLISDTLFFGIKRLEINVCFFDINVEASLSDTVKLHSEINTETKGLVINKTEYKLKYEKKDSVLVVSMPRSGGNILIVGSLRQEAILNFIIPELTEVIINNESGNVAVAGLKGKPCRVKNNYGNINVSEMHTDVDLNSATGDLLLDMISGNIKAETSFGDITIKDVKGTICFVKSNVGNVKMSSIQSDVEIKLATGDLSLSKITGNIAIETSFGDITGSELKGKTCRIKSKVGNVKLSEIYSDINVGTTTGDLTFNGATGNIKAETSYGNQLFENVSGDIILKGFTGDIKIKKIIGNLNITNSYGDVRLEESVGDLIINAQSGDVIGKNIEVKESAQFKTKFGNIKMQLKNDMNDLSFDLGSVYGEIKIKKGDQNFNNMEGKLKLTQGKITITGSTETGDQIYE
jgi:DUF4097 and DUF4098 domain-containing protein YvlB